MQPDSLHELDTTQSLLPREKLQKYGRDRLTNEELVAILLRTGCEGRHVLDVATELVRFAGTLDSLLHLSTEQIKKQVKGIGSVKALTLVAAFELGLRALREKIVVRKMNNPEHVYEYLSSFMRWEDQEQLIVLTIDARHNLLRHHCVSKGTVNETHANPREILHPVIAQNAYGFILAHNHPSGDPSPSHADNSLTQRVRECAKLLGVHFVDHIIIGKPSNDPRQKAYFSYKHLGEKKD